MGAPLFFAGVTNGEHATNNLTMREQVVDHGNLTKDIEHFIVCTPSITTRSEATMRRRMELWALDNLRNIPPPMLLTYPAGILKERQHAQDSPLQFAFAQMQNILLLALMTTCTSVKDTSSVAAMAEREDTATSNRRFTFNEHNALSYMPTKFIEQIVHVN